MYVRCSKVKAINFIGLIENLTVLTLYQITINNRHKSIIRFKQSPRNRNKIYTAVNLFIALKL